MLIGYGYATDMWGEVNIVFFKVSTYHGLMYVTVNEVDSKPFKVLATIDTSSRAIIAILAAISRLVSQALCADIEVMEIVKAIRGDTLVFQQDKCGQVLSISDGIAWALENHYLKSNSEIFCQH